MEAQAANRRQTRSAGGGRELGGGRRRQAAADKVFNPIGLASSDPCIICSIKPKPIRIKRDLERHISIKFVVISCIHIQNHSQKIKFFMNLLSSMNLA